MTEEREMIRCNGMPMVDICQIRAASDTRWDQKVSNDPRSLDAADQAHAWNRGELSLIPCKIM
jgi:hypothetical protein